MVSHLQHSTKTFCLFVWKKAELTPESERGSSVYLVSTSFFLSTELGLHLPQRSSARSRSRLPATHRRRGGLKITPLTKYRFPAASADSGLILLSNRYNKRTLKKRQLLPVLRFLFVCSPRASFKSTGERATATKPRERWVTAYLHVTGGKGGKGGKRGGRGVAKSIWAVGDSHVRVEVGWGREINVEKEVLFTNRWVWMRPEVSCIFVFI